MQSDFSEKRHILFLVKQSQAGPARKETEAWDPGKAKIVVELLFWKKKTQTQQINKTKQKEFYIILGNESILCGFDFLTRQSGICRQIIPHRHGQPLSSCYRVARPPHKLKSKHKTHSSSAKPFLFLCESCLSYISHLHNKVSPSFPYEGFLRSGK